MLPHLFPANIHRTVIIVALLALTPRNEMHSASVVFGTEGLIDGAPGWDGGVSFLFGLLSVQWTMTVSRVVAFGCRRQLILLIGL